MKQTKFSAPDIECDGCANAIKKAMGKVEGVSDVAVDVPAKMVTVTHDPASATQEEVMGALDRAGFPATVAAAGAAAS